MSEAIPTCNGMTPTCGATNFSFLNQPGQVEIQSDLFYDDRINVDNYPRWESWMGEKEPRLVVFWA